MKNKPSTINRSGAKWLPGAMALAATAVDSQAATVQITLTGNKVSSTGGNQFNADLTGDGSADLTRIAGETSAHKVVFLGVDMYGGGPNILAKASFAAGSTSSIGYYEASVWPIGKYGNSPQSATHARSILFSDSRINGGLATFAWLEINAFNTGSTNNTVEFKRLVFDDASTTLPDSSSLTGVQTEWSAVPEPSSFALLSLGAGGLLARRRRQAA
jgi:hypothetical protein